MTTTLDPSPHPVTDDVRHVIAHEANTDPIDSSRHSVGGSDRRVWTAGLAGLVWFGLLVITNLINGPASPTPDATVDEVIAHLTDHRAIIILVTGAFVAGIPFVVWFFAGVAGVLRRRGQAQAADAGLLSVAGILTLFGLAALTRLGLMTAIAGADVDESSIWTLWKVHDVVFNVNQACIGGAILAFGLGGVAAGLLPRWIKVVSLLGGLTLIANAVVLTVPIAEGANAALVPGLIGFVLWLVFVATCSIRMMRLGSARPTGIN